MYAVSLLSHCKLNRINYSVFVSGFKKTHSEPKYVFGSFVGTVWIKFIQVLF